jgi:predicted dehydrogenase
MLYFTVLGKFKTAHAIIANQRPVVQVLKQDGSVAIKDFQKTADDHILLHGTVEGGAVVSYNLRGGKHFPDTPGMEWRVYGEKGEIRLIAPGLFLNVGYPDTKISVHDFASNEVSEVGVAKNEFESFPQAARNVAQLYDAIGKGDTTLLCDFEDAVERHRFIDMIYKQNGMTM